jgi:hypothetical protein
MRFKLIYELGTNSHDEQKKIWQIFRRKFLFGLRKKLVFGFKDDSGAFSLSIAVQEFRVHNP